MASHRRLFERAVHAHDLSVGPRVADLCQAMPDPMFITDAIKDVVACVFALLAMGEPGAVVRQDRVDATGQSGYEMRRNRC